MPERTHCRDCAHKLTVKRRGELRCYGCERKRKRLREERKHEMAVCAIYGLRLGEYARIKEFQGGVCAICQRAKGTRRHLSVDHDHKTGAVRGLLCNPCNQFLGHARDDAEFFARCAAYLLDPPARQVIGMREAA